MAGLKQLKPLQAVGVISLLFHVAMYLRIYVHEKRMEGVQSHAAATSVSTNECKARGYYLVLFSLYTFHNN